MKKRAAAITAASIAAVMGITTVGYQSLAANVILDDLVVTGSACVGIDCANGENFGFDTLRLKENNLRIKFDDTSASASFPGNDWQLTANDSDNGGLNKFSIDDITAGRTPFTVEAGARSHALYVDDLGRIGIGTNAPTVRMHQVDGNTPTIRLEQDGSSGFTAQTFDIASNESNFFVRDVNNSSSLPFRIKPGSGNDNALVIAADGDVGLGTETPEASLDVSNAGPSVLQLTDRTNNIDFKFETTASGQLRISRVDTGTATEFIRVLANGRILLKGDVVVTGSLTVAGDVTCTAPSQINGAACV